MRKKLFTISGALCAMLSFSMIVKAAPFDLTTFEGDVPAGTEVVTIEGVKYWKVVVNGWNTTFPIAEINTGNNNKVIYKAKADCDALDTASVAMFLKLYNSTSGDEIFIGKDASKTVVTDSVDIVADKTYDNIQLALQVKTGSWPATVDDTIYISKLTFANIVMQSLPPRVTATAKKVNEGVIEIDGIDVEDEWETVDPNNIDQLALGSVTGPSDNSGYFKALYDKYNLYLFVNITDNDPINYDGATKSWENDGIELYTDMLERRYPGGARLSSAGQPQHRINLGREDADQWGMGDYPITWAELISGPGYAFEIAMPWKGLITNTSGFDTTTINDVIDANGFKMGFEISILDADAVDHRKSILNWSNNTGQDKAYTTNEFDGRLISEGYVGIKNINLAKSLNVLMIDNNTVRIQLPGLKSVSVYNVSGAEVIRLKTNANTTNLSIGLLPAGVYIIKASDGKSYFTNKIMKR